MSLDAHPQSPRSDFSFCYLTAKHLNFLTYLQSAKTSYSSAELEVDLAHDCGACAVHQGGDGEHQRQHLIASCAAAALGRTPILCLVEECSDGRDSCISQRRRVVCVVAKMAVYPVLLQHKHQRPPTKQETSE